MKKFLAVVKHEYKKIVLKWTFLLGTLMLPLLALVFSFVPALIFSIKGEPARIAVYDQSGKIGQRLKDNLSAEKIQEKASRAAKESLTDFNASQEEKMKRNAEQFGESFDFIDFKGEGKTMEEVRAELTGRIAAKQLDAFLIIPADYAGEQATFEFYSRNAGDFIVNTTLQDALNDAVRSQRLADANINEEMQQSLGRKVDLEVKKVDETGAETENSAGFWAGFVIALLIYLTLAIYGQLIMSAIVEEKETRVAEILFSSAKPFELMMGKLVGVGLAGLTQLAIWVITVAVFLALLLPQLAIMGIQIPVISPLMIIYFFIFFLLGFFIYASIFALIGSMVTSVQEGGQFAFLPVMLMLGGFYFCFAIIRDPNSTVSFWASVAPFVAPLTMPVRIVMEPPPVWQILLAILLNSLTITALVWLAARVYRVGMLMYGKRATIPEVWKWIRQS